MAATRSGGQKGSSTPPRARSTRSPRLEHLDSGRRAAVNLDLRLGTFGAVSFGARSRWRVGASRSSEASSAAAGRAPGAVSSARATTASRARGRSRRFAASGGAPSAIAPATCRAAARPRTGAAGERLPQHDADRPDVAAQRRVAAQSRSGAMYASVPGTSPTAVRVSASSNCARPKSSRRTAMSSPSSTSTLDGFTSRCTIP